MSCLALSQSRRSVGRAVVGFCVVAMTAGCATGPPVLTQLLAARRLASDLHVQFTKAAEASNRAVMVGTDEASAAAAMEAEQAIQEVQRNVEQLEPVLQSLRYSEEITQLNAFKARFGEYRTLDQEILPLAAENTNLKAQRLSFGPARDAADAFRGALNGAAQLATSVDMARVEVLVLEAHAELLQILVIQAPHIAEADDSAMTRMEAEMAASEAAAREAVASLKALLPPSAGHQLAAASAVLDRFTKINAEIVSFSRRNSNVRSLALSVGRKRTVTALCDDHLRALEESLAKHEFTGSR